MYTYHIKSHNGDRIASFQHEYDRDHFYTKFLSDGPPGHFEKEDEEVEQKDVCEKDVYAYMCAVDWKYEVPHNLLGNQIFYDLKSLKEFRSCVEECGIVRVKMSFVETIQEGTV